MDLETGFIIKKTRVFIFYNKWNLVLLLKNYQSDFYLEVKLHQKKMKKRRRKGRENRALCVKVNLQTELSKDITQKQC